MICVVVLTYGALRGHLITHSTLPCSGFSGIRQLGLEITILARDRFPADGFDPVWYWLHDCIGFQGEVGWDLGGGQSMAKDSGDSAPLHTILTKKTPRSGPKSRLQLSRQHGSLAVRPMAPW